MIRNNPFNALCSHGISSTSIQTRLVLVLDEKTGLPVWYSVIPGNIMDLSTLHTTMEDVAESLDICISNFVLDAGYASKEMLQFFQTDNTGGNFVTVRMPAQNGYPYKTLYHQSKKLMNNAKYEFIRQGHAYFWQAL
jgi:transposase